MYERAAERIRLTRRKLAAYSCYLSEERDRLERELTEASKLLRLKVESIASTSSSASS